MPWNKNGPLCPNCGAPVSRQVPIVKIRIGKKRAYRLHIENPLISINGAKRCLACSTYVKYISSRHRPGREGRRYLLYKGKGVCPFSLGEQGWRLWKDLQKQGCVDGKTLNYSHFFYEATSFESYWEKWFSVVEPYLLPDVKIKKAVGTNGR
ncbi:hypothetical protein J7K05_02090 [bacterium]|nr:hypothetical protein [bacterium]